jgi:CRP-like cAMP-binding protein
MRGRASASICQVLREDPELAERVPPADRPQAIEHCIARAARIPRGDWTHQRAAALRDGIGLLALEGLLIRRVGVDGRFGAELLGKGDLLQPWQGQDMPSPLGETTERRVLEPMRVALLDEPAARRLARYPGLIGGLVGRALERSGNLAVNMAIVHHARVEVRLHMLFWHLADRWGRVRSDGIAMRLPLTHSVLADLVAARRPTVTSALSELAKRGLVRLVDRTWLLSGEPPGELLELQPVTVGQAEQNPRALADLPR